MKVLFHVQHLLGIGHLRRAAAITRALVARGAAVTVASGGHPVPGTDFGAATLVQLPPARAADAGFSVILDQHDRPIDQLWRQERAAQLRALFRAVAPDVLLIESYPFGRRAFRFELEPMLAEARTRRPRPLIACSVRDILVARTDPVRLSEMANAAAGFDLILVHGDPALIAFGATFPLADRIADRLRYTGYVAAPQDPGTTASGLAPNAGTGEVVVSVGGGAVGLPLLTCAVAARPLSTAADLTWRLLAGPDLPAAAVAVLAESAPAGVIVERSRPDFPLLLQRCRLSISQGGYNTVLDLLQAGCRAVVVPFAAGRETEQSVRADLLAARGVFHVLAEQDLSPERLAAAVDRALAAPGPPRVDLAMDGADATAALLTCERPMLLHQSTGFPRRDPDNRGQFSG